MVLEVAADHRVELRPQGSPPPPPGVPPPVHGGGVCGAGAPAARPPPRCPPAHGSPGRVAVVRITRRVNAGNALAAADEIHERLAPRVSRRLVVRIVEERARGAVEEDQVVLFEVRFVDRRRVVGHVRRPRAGLLAHLLDHLRGERNGRVHETACCRQHEDLARALRLGRRGRGQHRHHTIDVVRTRDLRLRAATTTGVPAAATPLRSGGAAPAGARPEPARPVQRRWRQGPPRTPSPTERKSFVSLPQGLQRA